MKKIFYTLLLLACGQFSFGQWNTDRIMNIGKNALQFEDYVLSIQYFNQVIKIKPYLAEPYIYRGIAKISLGDYTGAEQDCTEAIERNPFVPQAYYARGFARKNINKFQEAIVDFNKALEFSPENTDIIANRGEVREKNNDLEGAIDDLNLYRKLNPKARGIDYEIGRIQLAMKDTVAALVSLDKFIISDSTNATGYSIRALIKMLQKDEKSAFEDYNKAVAYKSSYSGDYINRGILNVQRNKFNQALSDYNEAIRLDPKSTLAYYNRGLLRANLGDSNNAIGDLDKVVAADSTNYEARLQKAYLELKVGDMTSAIGDFNVILKKYPFFVPAYLGIADAKQGLGRKKEANQYRNLASEIVNNKDYYKRKQNLVAKNQIARETPVNELIKPVNLVEKFTANNAGERKYENKYGEGVRGEIQNSVADLKDERNFELTYNAPNAETSRTNTYHPLISKLNGENTSMSSLKIANDMVVQSAEQINTHFAAINRLSEQLKNAADNSELYFFRALEFSLVQDYTSAIDDLNKAIELRSNFALAYFTRANLRFKQLEYQSINQSEYTQETKNKVSVVPVGDENTKIQYELILRDYDKTIDLTPDFSFAYFNKGNLYRSMKNFKSAVSSYSKAIEIDPDFAESYYNRGISHLYLNDKINATQDLSKSGELGIYQSYSIIKRLQE